MTRSDKWMTRQLVNDHHHNVENPEEKQSYYIGLRYHEDGLPVMISLGRPNYLGPLNLNKVYGGPGALHLSEESIDHLDSNTREELLESGSLTHGRYHICLIPKEGFSALVEQRDESCTVCEPGPCTCTPVGKDAMEFHAGGVILEANSSLESTERPVCRRCGTTACCCSAQLKL